MANPITRLVKLILDRKSAKDTEDGAKEALGGIDGALGKLGAAAKRLGGILAAAFAVGKIVDFGRAAVEEAARGEREWSKLANTLTAVGENAAGMRDEIEASAAAFQSATTYGAGDYLDTLDRMIVLTGDVEASTANMGMVANVAAQFFDGELAPAADLVAKAMNGNVAALQKIGIQAEDAQGALEILASRSMGAAEARAQTFSGRVSILTELWNDFLDGVGNLILESEGAGEALNFLTAAVQWLTQWVRDNEETLREWVTKGVRFAITAADVLLRTVLGLADLFQGGFKTSIGIAAVGVSYLARAYALAYEAAAKFLGLIGAKDTADSLRGTAEIMREGADAIQAWGENAIASGGENVARGLNQFTRPLFTAGQFAAGGSSAGAGRGTLGEGGAPRMAAGARGGEPEELERIETQVDRMNAVLEAFGDGMRQNSTLAQLLGEDFNALEAEARLLESSIGQLVSDGFDESDPVLQMMRDRLGEVRGEMELLEEATRMEEEAMRAQAFAAGELSSAIGAAMAGGLAPFAKSKAKQNLLEAAELAIRATISALTGFGAARAGAFAAAAGKHLAIAGAWGALGASMGGGGGTGGAVTPTGGGGATATPTAARQTTSSASRDAKPLAADVSIYLTGPGFDALNPEVQRVVRGAMQESTDRYGNARVRVVRRSGA
jgi:hypothetical protein